MQGVEKNNSARAAGSRFSHEKLKWQSVVFTGVLVLVTLVCLIWISDRQVRRDVLVETSLLLHENNVTHELVLQNSLQRLRRDVSFLSETPPVQGVVRAHQNNGYDSQLRTSGKAWKERLKEIFSAYLHANPTATQVRFIGVDSGGKEIVRVDQRDGEIIFVEEQNLQKKGGRRYFRETVERKGDVYISDINLNRENGRVEALDALTVRAGIAVLDSEGDAFGAIVINTSANHILNSLSSDVDSRFSAYVLNENGYFVYNSDDGRKGESEPAAGWSAVLPELLKKGELSSMSDGSIRYSEFNNKSAYFSVEELRFDELNKQRRFYIVTAISSGKIEEQVAKIVSTTIYILLLVAALILVFLYVVSVSARRRDLVNFKNAEIAAIVNHSTDAIIGLTASGYVKSWNPGAELMFGYAVEDAVGASILDLVVDRGRREEEMAVLDDARLGGNVISHVEIKRRRKNGGLINVEMTVSPILSELGDVIGVANICRDTSPLKEAQRRILEVNASLEKTVSERTAELAGVVSVQRAILEGAGYAIIATDIEGKITHFNRAAEEMLGYRDDEVIGKLTPGSFHDTSEIIARAKVLSQQLGYTVKPGMESVTTRPKMGEPEEREWTFRRKDGSRLPVLLKVTGLFNDDGALEGFLGIAMDLTARKETQRQLIEAKESADQANRAKSEFLANMSHEIRTPMNAVIGMLQLIRNTPLNEKQMDYVDKSRGAAKSLLLILNDILDLSKIESGKMLLDPISFSVDALLRDVSTIISIGVSNKPVEIVFEIAPDVPSMVVGDSLRIQQVLINIAGNAVKFTSRGEVVISIDLVSSDDEDVRLGFSVRDTGIGMTAEQQNRLFSSFSQAEAGTTRRYGGTGLGLVISRRLIQLMSGDLELESHEGIGSTFSFTLLLQKSDEEYHLSERIADEVLLNLRVLILDDNDIARAAITQLAESIGWEADCASDSNEALRLLEEAAAEEEPYQLIFVDWFLPNSGAKALLPEMSRLADKCAVDMSVIAMTPSHLVERFADDIDSEGLVVDSVVNKPVTPSDLLDAAADVLLAKHRRNTRHASGLQSDVLFGLNILLVEDNVNNQQVAKELLEMAGAKVTVAEDGVVSVDILRADGLFFDAVLMDIQMPRMDGYQATRKIREELELVNLPIIAMTANAMPNDRKACFDAGMNEHIGKPFEVDNLIGVLLASISKTPLSRVSAPPPMIKVKPKPKSSPQQRTSENDAFLAAMKRFNNDIGFFSRHALGFVSRYDGGMTEIFDRAEQADHDAFFREIHSLKGLAATVGAVSLERYMRDVEQHDKSDDWKERVLAMLPRAEELLSQAKDALATFVDTQSAPVGGDSNGSHRQNNADQYSREQVLKLIERLARYLSDVNMESLSVYDELKAVLTDQNEIDLTLLESAVYELDFDAALTHLEALKAHVSK